MARNFRVFPHISRSSTGEYHPLLRLAHAVRSTELSGECAPDHAQVACAKGRSHVTDILHLKMAFWMLSALTQYPAARPAGEEDDARTKGEV